MYASVLSFQSITLVWVLFELLYWDQNFSRWDRLVFDVIMKPIIQQLFLQLWHPPHHDESRPSCALPDYRRRMVIQRDTKKPLLNIFCLWFLLGTYHGWAGHLLVEPSQLWYKDRLQVCIGALWYFFCVKCYKERVLKRYKHCALPCRNGRQLVTCTKKYY